MWKRAEKNGNGQKKMRKRVEKKWTLVENWETRRSIWKWAEIMRKQVENICNWED